ncbi:hypothetical protein SHAM105786_10705 [Shewanella amazonensis]
MTHSPFLNAKSEDAKSEDAKSEDAKSEDTHNSYITLLKE